VIRYCILYFSLFVIFLALIVGPVIAGKYLKGAGTELSKQGGILGGLVQPAGLNKNDTVSSLTGYFANHGGATATDGGGDTATSTDSGSFATGAARLKLMVL